MQLAVAMGTGSHKEIPAIIKKIFLNKYPHSLFHLSSQQSFEIDISILTSFLWLKFYLYSFTIEILENIGKAMKKGPIISLHPEIITLINSVHIFSICLFNVLGFLKQRLFFSIFCFPCFMPIEHLSLIFMFHDGGVSHDIDLLDQSHPLC